MWQPNFTIGGKSIPEERLGLLEECNFPLSGAALNDVFERRGYLLLRGVLDREQVLEAREEVFGALQKVGEIRSPPGAGIATGESRRRETAGDLGAFWQAVSEGKALRRVTHGETIHQILAVIFDEEVRGHDMIYLRPSPPGWSTRLHYDYPFFAGFADRIYTCWIPLGEISLDDGPLVVVENSHHFEDLVNSLREIDYHADRSNEVVQRTAYEKQNASDPISLAQERGVRLLTASFEPGDLVVFSGLLMHGSLDNQSPVGRVRLSVDVRYQAAADRCDDPRYFGPQPRGSGGGGYADMKGAKPLTEL